jgi:cell division protein ZapA
MKNRAEVIIAGNTFTITGEQDEEYMVKIAALVDQKIAEIRGSGANTMQAITLAACDIADSYVQSQEGADHLRQQMASYLEENAKVNRELAEARTEIGRLETRAAERADEISHIEQLKDRIISLEQQVAGEDKRRARIGELESQLAQSEMRIRAFQDDAEKRTRRIKDLEQQLSDAEARHRDDMEEAEKRERLVRELQDKLSDAERQRRRIEELEKTLADTESQLNDVRSRLVRARAR